MTPKQIQTIIYNLELNEEFAEYIEDLNSETIDEARTLFYSNNSLGHECEGDEKVFALMKHTGENFNECYKYIMDDTYFVLAPDELTDKLQTKYIHKQKINNTTYYISNKD